jgi:hypothetical protein
MHAEGSHSWRDRSLRINLDMRVARALKNSQLTCGDVTIICETVH